MPSKEQLFNFHASYAVKYERLLWCKLLAELSRAKRAAEHHG